VQRRGRETIDKQWSVCTRPFTQCARLQCMYTPTIGAHLGSLCMRALPHFGLGILAIPCNTVRGYVCETSRNPAKPCDTSAISARNHRETVRYHRETTAKPYVLHMVYWLPYRHSEDKCGICEARAQSQTMSDSPTASDSVRQRPTASDSVRQRPTASDSRSRVVMQPIVQQVPTGSDRVR
jgi:hypothetical protein